jgi:diacylglycerol kinase
MPARDGAQASFLKSLQFAFEGLTWALSSQRNMQIHFIACALVALVVTGLPMSSVQQVLMLLSCGVVLAFELVNCALEQVVDIASPEINLMAKRSKDAAAAAVLVASFFAALTLSVFVFDTKDFISAHVDQIQSHALLGCPLVVCMGALVLEPKRRRVWRVALLVVAGALSAVTFFTGRSYAFSAVLVALPVISFLAKNPRKATSLGGSFGNKKPDDL